MEPTSVREEEQSGETGFVTGGFP